MEAIARLLPWAHRREASSEENEFIELRLPFNAEDKSERTDNVVITSKYTWYNFVFVRCVMHFVRV